jgi:hypothetical protein
VCPINSRGILGRRYSQASEAWGRINSDFDVPAQLVDDFQLQPGASTITDVHWWGEYANPNNPGTPGTDDFTIRIFGDVSGTPEIDPLNEFAVGAVNRVSIGVIDGDEVFAYSVDIAPLTLAANTTYWLSIVNDTTLDTDDNWFWNLEVPSATTSVKCGRGVDGAIWGQCQLLELGFQLTNDALAVPEPATWAMFAAGPASLGLMNRRRKAG